MKLSELVPGNVFYAKNDRKRILHKVEGKGECSILATGEKVSKSGRLEIVLHY